MVRRLRPVGLDFAETAPLRLVFTADAAARPETVYRALAEEVTEWPTWYRAVTLARPVDGARGREVRLVGGVRFVEAIMAAEAPERYAYRVDEVNVPGVRALLEEWRLAPIGAGDGAGTRVRWTFAVDAAAPVRGALRLARPGFGRAFRDAVRALDRRLAAV
ncbi:SRPBCC family protein [Streptomyces sp. NPDC057654]|uniref:SRPBCC family protein n=1 Tax=Streptomyces sp. NPDC057654 TaxID=3346196 RepID=UPI00369554D4